MTQGLSSAGRVYDLRVNSAYNSLNKGEKTEDSKTKTAENDFLQSNTKAAEREDLNGEVPGTIGPGERNADWKAKVEATLSNPKEIDSEELKARLIFPVSESLKRTAEKAGFKGLMSKAFPKRPNGEFDFGEQQRLQRHVLEGLEGESHSKEQNQHFGLRKAPSVPLKRMDTNRPLIRNWIPELMERAQIHSGTTEPLSEFEILRHEMLEADIGGTQGGVGLNHTLLADQGNDFDDAADDFGAMEDLPSRVLDDNFVNEPYQIPTQGTVFGSGNSSNGGLGMNTFDAHSAEGRLSARSDSNRAVFDFSEHFWKIVSNYKQLKGRLIRRPANRSQEARAASETSPGRDRRQKATHEARIQ